MREQIAKIFNDRIKKVFGEKQELLRFFLNHERKNLCIDNLVKEMRTAQYMVGAVLRDDEKGRRNYREMVEHTADLFCRACLGQKEIEIMSSAEKRRQSIAPEHDLLEFEAEINEENAKVHRGQIVGQGWKPTAINTARGRKVPKLLIP